MQFDQRFAGNGAGSHAAQTKGQEFQFAKPEIIHAESPLVIFVGLRNFDCCAPLLEGRPAALVRLARRGRHGHGQISYPAQCQCHVKARPATALATCPVLGGHLPSMAASICTGSLARLDERHARRRICTPQSWPYATWPQAPQESANRRRRVELGRGQVGRPLITNIRRGCEAVAGNVAIEVNQQVVVER
jgi:hypothetical protein